MIFDRIKARKRELQERLGDWMEEDGKLVIPCMRMTKTAKLPTRGSREAAGLDLYADLMGPMSILPGETKNISSGIAVEIPEGYFGGVFCRSGLATKRGLRLPNCVGIIDSDYRGPIGVALHNDSYERRVVLPGERVAQLIILPYPEIRLVDVAALSTTERGEKGFGSTGRR